MFSRSLPPGTLKQSFELVSLSNELVWLPRRQTDCHQPSKACHSHAQTLADAAGQATKPDKAKSPENSRIRQEDLLQHQRPTDLKRVRRNQSAEVATAGQLRVDWNLYRFWLLEGWKVATGIFRKRPG